jgi:hypothetical protein
MNAGSYRWLRVVTDLLGGKQALQDYSEGGPSPLPVPKVHRYVFGPDLGAELQEGAVTFTPAVNDILLDAWIDVDEAWDGTTPTADITQDGFEAAEGGSAAGGFFAVLGGGAVELDIAPQDLGSLVAQSADSNHPSVPLSAGNVHLGNPVTYTRTVPVRFTLASPVKLFVTQDGTPAGGDPASTVGQASLYVVTVTPADPRMH